MMTLRAKLAPILPCCLDYRVFAVDDSIPGQDAASVALFRKLGLSRHETELFYDAFNAVDANRSGTLDAFEFGDAVGDLQPSDVENFGESELAGKLFGSFDLDHGTQSEGLDFKEFVVSIWNYATYSQSELSRFAFFNLCELDARTNLLEYRQAKDYLRHFARDGGDKTEESLQKACEQMDADADGHIDMNEFVKWTAKHPASILPLIRAQTQLQTNIMGRTFWKKQIAKRDDVLDANTQEHMTDEDLQRALNAQKGLDLERDADHSIHHARSFHNDETITPFQTEPKRKEQKHYVNELTTKSATEKLASLKKQQTGNKYIYKPNKAKQKKSHRDRGTTTRRGGEEVSAAMMRVEAIRRKQRLKEKQRAKVAGDSKLAHREKNVEKHYGSYSRATVNRKLLRRLSFSSSGKLIK
jgi:Ca2+-binding EF-hand superfamily protein